MKTQAFTFLEMLVSLAIVAIFAAIAIPSWTQFSHDQQDQLLQSHIMQALGVAQQMAEVQNAAVIVCPSNQTGCSSDHPRAFIVFKDTYGDARVHKDDQILTRIPLDNQGVLFWRDYPHHVSYFRFSRRERFSTSNGSWWYCRTDGLHPAWAIAISRAGEAHAMEKNTQGIYFDSHGKALACR